MNHESDGRGGNGFFRAGPLASDSGFRQNTRLSDPDPVNFAKARQYFYSECRCPALVRPIFYRPWRPVHTLKNRYRAGRFSLDPSSYRSDADQLANIRLYPVSPV